MFYQIIKRKRDHWLHQPDCPIRATLQYIERRGMMRDAQVDAIKTYLFLKIACQGKPLWQLFSEGNFLTIDVQQVKMTGYAREALLTDTAAATLYEYACLTDDQGNTVAPNLKALMEESAHQIDCRDVFRRMFYGVSYPDYLFSLPMGAGKTYLMASFIYLDLYFSLLEPDNPAFAHNFMVLAPSGLKSSILPSIKHIQDFDPTWILPDPVATQLRNEIIFEVLDEQKTARKSNIVKNPNAQKINNHQPLQYLRGLVAVTNAEKVILDRFDPDADPNLFSDEEMREQRVSNELRSIIGQIPRLAIFIDEVHHASDGEIKLRQVVNEWTQGDTFCNVVGFSGTPYLPKAERVEVGLGLTMQNKNLANVVYHYPLIEGVGNFLKQPIIKTGTGGQTDIVREGVTEFLDRYAFTIYADGTCAKLAIYCGRIETLEETVYPLVAELVAAHGLDPNEAILRYHGGNKQYPASDEAATSFASLDTRLSNVRIVLLAQIGKEGWDCRSLTAVILPQKGACPQNMVLQTSCRCLRQVIKGLPETALIWLNEENANTLNKELKKQQHTSIAELNQGRPAGLTPLERFSRMDRVQVPPIDFYQLKVSYTELVLEEELNTPAALASPSLLAPATDMLVSQQNLRGQILDKATTAIADDEAHMPMTFSQWLHLTVKESFGTIAMQQLTDHTEQLHAIYLAITEDYDGDRRLRADCCHRQIRANVRKAFIPRRTIETRQEDIPRTASLLAVESLTSPIYVANTQRYYPDQREVHRIMEGKGEKRMLKPAIQAIMDQLRQLPGQESFLQAMIDNPENYEQQRGDDTTDRTFHYLPYHFDSSFEQHYFADTLLADIAGRGLEVYFNGDDLLTDFKIRCYKQTPRGWVNIGLYVPDFLMLSRDSEGQIHKVLIIETKGEGYAAQFSDRRTFMDEFKRRNNERFGYERFDFLYIEDTLSPKEQDMKTLETINHFFQ